MSSVIDRVKAKCNLAKHKIERRGIWKFEKKNRVVKRDSNHYVDPYIFHTSRTFVDTRFRATLPRFSY
jgi:hypothetical protein